MPVYLRSDNGFRSSLLQEFARYAGIRNIHVLPYSPWANGQAEQGVSRISKMLVRHCKLFSDWHLSIPAITFALNCSIHKTIGMSPFFAVFGRRPINVPELEDSQLQVNTSSGHDFVQDLAFRLREAWRSVQDASLLNRADQNAQHDNHRTRLSSREDQSVKGIKAGDDVMLRHGSEDHARRLGKHGYPVLRRFRVEAVIPETQSIRIDPRGTGIQPQLLIHDCAGRCLRIRGYLMMAVLHPVHPNGQKRYYPLQQLWKVTPLRLVELFLLEIL